MISTFMLLLLLLLLFILLCLSWLPSLLPTERASLSTAAEISPPDNISKPGESTVQPIKPLCVQDPGLGRFTSLPKEIFDRIFVFALRPDCMYREQCLKPHVHNDASFDTTQRLDIATLSSRIFSETMPLLRVSGMSSTHLTFHCPKITSPIHAWSVGRINLLVDLPEEWCDLVWINSRRAKFVKQAAKLKKLVKALQSNRSTVRELRLFLSRKDKLARTVKTASQRRREREQELGFPMLLLDLITAVYANGGEISLGRDFAREEQWNQDAEPFVPWLLQAALEKGVVVTRMLNPTARDRDMIEKLGLAYTVGDVLLPEKPGTLTYGMLEREINAVDAVLPRRELVPECRGCFEVFDNTSELENHLNELSSHRVPVGFREPQEEEVDEDSKCRPYRDMDPAARLSEYPLHLGKW